MAAEGTAMALFKLGRSKRFQKTSDEDSGWTWPFYAKFQTHFAVDPRNLPVVGQEFEVHEHPNLHLAIEELLKAEDVSKTAFGVARGWVYHEVGLAALVRPYWRGESAPAESPVEYVNIPLDGDRVVACVRQAVFLVQRGPVKLAVFLARTERPGSNFVSLEVMALDRETAEKFVAEIRSAMRKRSVYRGRVISLSSGGVWNSAEITFHSLPEVSRQRIILPKGLLERIELQTIGFGQKGAQLLAAGRHLKRGILLHGAPGTGKTLTAMYLAGRMRDRTTLLLTGRGLGLVSRTCALARMLQPSIVILEDVDLIAEERTKAGQGCATPVLFELLNEMDGLSDDVDVIFLLTTNRPDLLEPALASRPGRVDMAIEIPLPDEDGRRSLFALYGAGLKLELTDIDRFIKRTEGASPAFIRELFRKAALFAADGAAEIVVTDGQIDEALNELVVLGGDLTKNLLGFQPRLGFHSAS
jgi:hypothetical protein